MTARLVLACVLASGTLALAEDTSTSITSTTAPARVAGREEPLDLGFTSPQATMRGFLVAARAGKYDEAAERLDLRRLPRTHREATGPALARALKTVLDRTLWVDPETLSDAPDGDRDDGLPPRRDLVGTIRTSAGAVDIAVERVPGPDGTPQWKIAADTVAAIPALNAEFGDAPFADYVPDALNDVEIFHVRLWQWIGLGVLVAGGLAIGWLLAGSLVAVVGFAISRDWRPQHHRRLGALTGPLRLLVAVVVFAAGVPFLGLSVPAARGATILQKTGTIVGLTWFWLRVVDALAAVAADRLHLHGRAAAVSVIPLGRRTVKVFMAVLAGIAIMQNLGYDATGVLAGLGVGGLALALAAQKTVENLFGGVMLIADQPVRVGEQCRFGTRVGTVEDIGLRSTRLRTPERTIVSVPNAEFASMQIENLSVRDRMWLSTTLALRIATSAAQLRQVLDGLRRLLEQDRRLDRRSVRLVGIGAASLDVEVAAYVLTRDWDEFLAIREELFLKMLDLIGDAGTGMTPRGPAPSRPA